MSIKTILCVDDEIITFTREMDRIEIQGSSRGEIGNALFLVGVIDTFADECRTILLPGESAAATQVSKLFRIPPGMKETTDRNPRIGIVEGAIDGDDDIVSSSPGLVNRFGWFGWLTKREDI